MGAGREIPIDRNAIAEAKAETIFGDGVTVVSASFMGDKDSSGVYSDDGYATSPGVVPSDSGKGYGPGARPAPKSYEAGLLSHSWAA